MTVALLQGNRRRFDMCQHRIYRIITFMPSPTIYEMGTRITQWTRPRPWLCQGMLKHWKILDRKVIPLQRLLPFCLGPFYRRWLVDFCENTQDPWINVTVTHCGPITPNGVENADHHCFRWWLDVHHKDLTWANVNLMIIENLVSESSSKYKYFY